jgi:hypothetical protein
MPLFSRYFIILFIIILIIVSVPFTTILYIAKQAMAHVMSLDDKLEDKLESLTGNKNIRVVLLAQSLENKLNKSSTILQISRLPEIKSILQSRSNLTDNESVLLVDSFGHKAAAAYSNKAPSLFINTQEKPFSNLQSFKNAMAGKFGSILETINGNGNKVIVSYHPVKILSNTWVILLLQPYDKFVDELAREHDK